MRWTNLWRLWYVSRGDFHHIILELHKKYGPVVRLGPNLLDLDYPELTKTIYNTQGNWKKTEVYHGSSAHVGGKIVYNLFSETSEHVHSQQKRPIAKYYTATAVSALEPHMDQMLERLCQILAAKSVDDTDKAKVLDLGSWLSYFAWDVVGDISFSQPLGYLDKGCDFDGTLAIADKATDYFSLVGCMPFLDYLLEKNPLVRPFISPRFARITGVSLKHLMDRYAGKDGGYHDASKPDYLDHFLEAKKLYPNVVDDAQIISYLMINMGAGADTTAITLRAVFYYALKNPAVWAKLEEEVLAVGHAVPLSLKDARRLPYLDAVIKEAMRVHPAIGMTLERYVPPGGLHLPLGHNGGPSLVPAGTMVGLNPWVVHRNRDAYGEEADAFRPERWLRDENETEDEFRGRLRRMNDASLAFGAGGRSCIGKHISIMEIYKAVPSLIAKFQFELDESAAEWRTVNSWFVRQTGIKVRMRTR
ncbi:hypothetical protein LQW54_004614 [Pestalotiopsis sp. IQ-011]